MKAAPNGRCNRVRVPESCSRTHWITGTGRVSRTPTKAMSHRVLAIARARLAWHRHDGPLAKEAAGHYAMMAEFPVSGRDWPR